MVDSERAGQTLLENDPNSKYPKCQVFDLSIESNECVIKVLRNKSTWCLFGENIANLNK